VLRPIIFGSKSLTKSQLNYGAPKLEMYAVFYFIEKFHSYLAGREFTLRVDNQALSWLKTYSMDQAMIGRWIARLDQYNFKVVHRPRTQHRNADGLSKRTNDYVHRERIAEKMPQVREGFSFMTQKEFDELPTLPYINKHGHFIPDHPELPPEAKASQPLLYILTKQDEQTRKLSGPDSDIPWYPAVQWENTPATTDHEKPTRVMSITADAPAADIYRQDRNYATLPEDCKQHVKALREAETELHEHHSTVRGLAELHLAQSRDLLLTALRKLLDGEELDESAFPGGTRVRTSILSPEERSIVCQPK